MRKSLSEIEFTSELILICQKIWGFFDKSDSFLNLHASNFTMRKFNPFQANFGMNLHPWHLQVGACAPVYWAGIYIVLVPGCKNVEGQLRMKW